MEYKVCTRTLIQIGSIVNITGLLEYRGIELGEDLMAAMSQKDKAAILIGFLTDLLKDTSKEMTQAKQAHWKTLGIQQLKE